MRASHWFLLFGIEALLDLKPDIWNNSQKLNGSLLKPYKIKQNK